METESLTSYFPNCDNRSLPSCRLSLFQSVLVQNFSNESEFDLHENEHPGGPFFHIFSEWFLVLQQATVNSEMTYSVG